MGRMFSINELRTIVARALQDGDYVPADSARVRDVPDTRTIRYYTTLGLIDRPAEMRGRTAFYGARHVLQLVAIKRLQAQKMTLSDIQQRLAGLPTKKLQSLAALPSGFWDQAENYLAQTLDSPAVVASSSEQASADKTSSNEFWSRTAALPSTLSTPNQEVSARPISQSLQVALHPTAQLTISTSASAEHIDTASLQRLQAAAEPLINELIRQRLIVPQSPPTQDARP